MMGPNAAPSRPESQPNELCEDSDDNIVIVGKGEAPQHSRRQSRQPCVMFVKQSVEKTKLELAGGVTGRVM